MVVSRNTRKAILAAACLAAPAVRAQVGQNVWFEDYGLPSGNKQGVESCPDYVTGIDYQASNHDGDPILWNTVGNVCTDGARCCYYKHCPGGQCTGYCLYRPHDPTFGRVRLPDGLPPPWTNEDGHYCIDQPNPVPELWHPRGVTLESLQGRAPAQPQQVQAQDPSPPPPPQEQPQQQQPQQQWQPPPAAPPAAQGGGNSGHAEAHTNVGEPHEVWLSDDVRGDKRGVWDCPDAVFAVDETGSNAGEMIQGGDVPSACTDGSRCCYRRHCPGGKCSLFCLYRPHEPYYDSPQLDAPHWATEAGRQCPPYTDNMEMWYVQSVQNAAAQTPNSGAQATPDLSFVGCTEGFEVFVRPTDDCAAV